MKKALIFLAVLAIIMYLTNPNKEDFQAWTKQQLQERIEEEAQEEGVENALSGALSEIGGFFGNMMTTVDNYFLCSVYTLDMGRNEYKYLNRSLSRSNYLPSS